MAQLLIDGGSKAILDFFTASISAYVLRYWRAALVCALPMVRGAWGASAARSRLRVCLPTLSRTAVTRLRAWTHSSLTTFVVSRVANSTLST